MEVKRENIANWWEASRSYMMFSWMDHGSLRMFISLSFWWLMAWWHRIVSRLVEREVIMAAKQAFR
jgi:hypothetical protein